MPLEVSTALRSLCVSQLPGTQWTVISLEKKPFWTLGACGCSPLYACFVASQVFSGRAGGEEENGLQSLQEVAFLAL